MGIAALNPTARAAVLPRFDNSVGWVERSDTDQPRMRFSRPDFARLVPVQRVDLALDHPATRVEAISGLVGHTTPTVAAMSKSGAGDARSGRGGPYGVCKYGFRKPRHPHAACGDAEVSMASFVTASPRSADDGHHDQPVVPRRLYRLLRPAAVSHRRPDRREASARRHGAPAGPHLSRGLRRYGHAGGGAGALGGLCRAAWLATISGRPGRHGQAGPGLVRRRWAEVSSTSPAPRRFCQVADQRRWVAYAANHGWTDTRRQASGCVDPY